MSKSKLSENILQSANDVSDPVHLLLTKVAHDHTLPFDPLILNETTITAIMEAGSENLPRAHSIKELKKALHADD